MNMETKLVEKPDTLRSSGWKEWIRIQFLSPYLWRIPRDEKSLDLACGWGFSFKINPGFYGIEYDDACVAYLQRQNYKVQKGNLLEPLPYAEGFFDNCFSHDVLEHFEAEESDRIFANVHRVLKKGGRFINIIPNRRGYDFGLQINAGHKYFMTPEKIAEIATRTGFRFERSYASPLPAFFHPLFTHNKWVTICLKE